MPRKAAIIPALTDAYYEKAEHLVLDMGDFSGGMCKSKRPQQLEDAQAWEIKNFRPARDSKGEFAGWRTREGIEVVSTTSTASPILSGTFFNGEQITATSTAVYQDTGAALNEITRINGECSFLDAGSYLLILDGHYLKYWDGTTFGLCYDKSGYLVDNSSVGTTSHADMVASNAMVTVSFAVPAFDPIASGANSIPWYSVDMDLSTPGIKPVGYVRGVVCSAAGTVLYASTNTVAMAGLTSTAVTHTFSFGGVGTCSTGVTYRVGVQFIGTASAAQMVRVSTGPVGTGLCWVYDGAAWTSRAGMVPVGVIRPGLPPKGRVGVGWQRRIFVAPHRSQYLHYDHAGDIFDWSTAGAFNHYLFDQDSGNIVGLVVFAKDIIVIFRGGKDASGNQLHKSVWRLQGDTATAMSTFFIVDGISAIGYKACCGGGNNIYFMDDDRIYRLFTTDRYGDASLGLIDGDVEPLIEGNVGSNSLLTYDTKMGHLYVWADGGASGVALDYYLTYDVFLGIWWKTDFAGISEGTLFSANGEFYQATTKLYRMGGGLYLDDATLPTTAFWTKFYFMGSPFQLKRVEAFLVDVFTATGGSITVTACRDLDVGGHTSWTHTIGIAGLLWDEALMVWSDALWPWDYKIGSMLTIKDRKFRFTNLMVRLDDAVYTTQPVYINGIYVEAQLQGRRT